MASIHTVHGVAARIVQLGLVTAETVEQELDSDDLQQPLDFFGQPDSAAVLSMLDTLGIRYTTDYKTFRYACDDGSELYRDELERIAACTRGLLSITDVELVDDDGGAHVLRFNCNGQSHEWTIPHGDEDEENMDSQMTFSMGIGELVPSSSSARWCGVQSDDLDYGSQNVFGDPEALRLLGQEFGISFYLP